MTYLKMLGPFLLGWLLLLLSEELRLVAGLNGAAQALLFAGVVCIPVWRTGRLSFVDIGWPLGLVLIALTTYLVTEGYWLRTLLVCAAYALAGLRMGLGCIVIMIKTNFTHEFPRYQYRLTQWAQQGKKDIKLRSQAEVIMQGLGNASYLAMPAFIMGVNPDTKIAALEVAALILWFAAFAFESVADIQKLRFAQRMKQAGRADAVCDMGLWRFCRHPNYFGEWMIWNALVLAAVPSWLALYDEETLVVWVLLGIGLLLASGSLYYTLVYHTGAQPAEYFSERKRPEYRAYQATTNMFFPGPRKSV